MGAKFSETPSALNPFKHKPHEKPLISHIVILGDSLSDRGTLDHRYVFGCLPMAKLAGLSGESPTGRFANGYVWSDDISAMFSDEFVIRKAEKSYAPGVYRKYKFDTTDLSDAIISKQKIIPNRPDADDSTDISDSIISDRYFQSSLENSYTLDNNLYVQFRGRDFVRSYDEGGLSSHNYRSNPFHDLKITQPIASVSVFFSRFILSTLGKKREAMLEHDRQVDFSDKQKQETLVIEWSGANDLITVNVTPTKPNAEKAAIDRINNAEKLIKQGYRQFILFNMPDLSLTPSFQNKTGAGADAERQNAYEVCEFFNTNLQVRTQLLQEKYKDQGVSIKVYNIAKLFTDVYNDTMNDTKVFPVHFDKDKLHVPYIKAKDFAIDGKVSPATGYMFWNDVHPSADMHALLAEEFYKTYSDKFIFATPKVETPEMLCTSFQQKYRKMQQAQVAGSHGLFRMPNLPKIDYSNPVLAIAKILKLASEERGRLIRTAITELQWMDARGAINTNIPALREAKEELARIHPQPSSLRI